MNKEKTVLYFAHHALGDIVTQLPAINHLVERFGNNNIYLTVQFEYLLDFLSEYFKIPRENFYLKQSNFDSKKNTLKFIMKLRSEKFNYFIPSPIFGYKKVKLFNRLLNIQNTILAYENYEIQFKHKVLKNLEFLRLLESYDDEEIIKYANQFYTIQQAFYKDENINFFDKDRCLIIHIGCAVSEIFKRLPINKYERLINDILQNTNYKILLTGVGVECIDTQNLKDKFESDRVVDVCNKFNLKQLMKLIVKSKCVISADTGIAHLASILNKQNFVFVGPTDEKITGPYNNATFLKLDYELSCMPCYGTKKYGIKGCENIKCLNSINDKVISDVVLEYLK